MDARAAQLIRNSQILEKYIPPQAVPLIAQWISDFDFKLKITRERSSRLGDYTPPVPGRNHLITINHNLNRYSFLITLVHEIAHLLTYNKFGNRVLPHGGEWKESFRILITPFLNTDIFPPEVFSALRAYMQNPAASSCADTRLMRMLKLHDEDNGTIFLEHLPAGSFFLYNNSRVFRKGEKLRKRFKCTELSSGHIYLFNPLVEVVAYDPATARSA
jgi:SprT protein